MSTSTLSLQATVDYSAFPSPSPSAPQVQLERDSSPLSFTLLEPTSTSSRPSSSKRQAFEEAKALYESGLWISKDNPHSAIAHFLQASNVFSELRGQRNRRDKSLWQVGVCYGKIGWGAKKRKEWIEATEAFEEVSLAYFLWGLYVDSYLWYLGALRQALRVFIAIGDSEKEATTLYQLSLVSTDVLTASDYLKKAALIYSELNNDEKEAMCLAELGNLFGRKAKDVSSSLFHWRQALLLYTKAGDRDKEAKALYAIGELLVHSKREAAYESFSQARELFHQLESRTKWVGNCSYQLGKICVAQKRLEAAVQYFEEASSSFREVQLQTDEAWTLYRLALVMLKVRSQELAIDYLTEARRLFAEVGNEREAEGSCLLRLAEILKDSNPQMAKTLLEEALEFVDPVKEKRIERRSTLILQTLTSQLDIAPTCQAQSRNNTASSSRPAEQTEDESWSFAGATEEGGNELERIGEENEEDAELEEEAAEDVRDRRHLARGSSEGGEGAWWAI
ncbi:hypothetical protein JCM5350_004340 [Sporobolomyces pararoseus]